MATLYEHYNTNDDDHCNTHDDWQQWQSFTPQVSHNITLVKIKAWRVGSPGTVTVDIKVADVEHKPTDSALTSGTFDGNAITTSIPGEWVEVSLTPYQLDADTEYGLHIHCGGDINNQVHPRDDESSPTYERGYWGQTTDGGSYWSVYSTRCFMFEEWGDAGGVPNQILSNKGIQSVIFGEQIVR